MKDSPEASRSLFDRVQSWFLSEIDSGSSYRRQEIAAKRLNILAKNVATPAAAALISFLLAIPAILIVTVVMMGLGYAAALTVPSRRARLIDSCRHQIWTMVIAAASARAFIDWSTSRSSMGLPAMLGPHTSVITQMVGTEILPIMLSFAIILIPMFYVRTIYLEWRTTRSKGDTARKISLIGRYRKARPY